MGRLDEIRQLQERYDEVSRRNHHLADKEHFIGYYASQARDDIGYLLARVEAADNVYPVINAFMALSGVVDGLLTTHFNLSGMETYGEALKRLNALQEAWLQYRAGVEADDATNE